MSEKEWDGGVLTASEGGNAIRRKERQALRMQNRRTGEGEGWRRGFDWERGAETERQRD